MSVSGINGSPSIPIRPSRSMPTLVGEDGNLLGAIEISTPRTTGSGDRSAEATAADHSNSRFGDSSLFTNLPRPMTDIDGIRTPIRAKHRLRKVAKDIVMRNKYTRAFQNTDKLCDICSKLQLNRDKFIIQDHSSDPNQQAYKSYLGVNPAQAATSYPLGSGSGMFRLGSLREITDKRGTCPFCRLVRESLSVFHSDELNRDKYADAVCFASWQVDGREVVRDEIGHIISARPRTRRIQLRWNNSNLEDSYLVLMDSEQGRRLNFDPQAPWESNTLFLGRNMASAGNNQALAKRWLDICNACHGNPCQAERGKDFEDMISSAFFGVVDVHEMRLTSLPPHQPYAALSYMWGPLDHSYTTTLHNIQARQSPGELGKIFQSLPRVMQDAINLVRGLGLKYIWVDGLCIVQNSARSWNLNSSVMDLVYGNAHLTICATDGDDAQAGLQGISLDRIVSQHSQKCDTVRLMVSHLAETYVERSRWNTRGWTFQERLLSKRCLVFADSRVFFQCRSAAMSEDIVAEQEKGAWSIELVKAPLQLLQSLTTRPFWVYMECVRLYTARELSRSRDILAAFQGMSNLISQKLGAPLAFGLPSSHFDLALLWEPMRKSCRRLAETEEQRRSFEDMTFPSWSWCGWQGTAMEYRKGTIAGCLEDLRQWHAHHTWIKWYIRDFRGNLRLVWDKSQNVRTAPDMEPHWLGYQAQSSDFTTETDVYGRSINNHQGEQAQQDFNRTLPEYPYKISITRSRSVGEQQQDQRFLQFWTWSAYLRVIPHDQSNSLLGDGLDRYDIADYTGDWCGTIVLDDNWAEEPGSEHEFIAISDAKEFSPGENDNWSYYIASDRDQSDWSLYYVLLIKRERGIAHRLGLGKVFKDAFKNSCLPGVAWREIILE